MTRMQAEVAAARENSAMRRMDWKGWNASAVFVNDVWMVRVTDNRGMSTDFANA